ncbi:beta-1,3-galactosyltransferase 5 isoform X1 [Hydra vulgaris]|uniref:beta-1,3-galactosyltransferase 5 isoform X1 n=1 Tax=Hydra vulgaris TaxID=6087 RepID=UPI001F5EDAA4|nr:beta-1,3-galactosyltransferase 5 isoform X1 [Hydra vulgaris]
MRLSFAQILLIIAILIITTTFTTLVMKNNEYVDFAILEIKKTANEWKVVLNKFRNQNQIKTSNRNKGLIKNKNEKLKIKTFENLTLNTDIDILRKVLTLNLIKLDSVLKYRTTYRLLVMVTSQSRNSVRRKWIRKLWGNKSVWKSKKWRLVFVTGQEQDDKLMKKLTKEAKRYKDILIVDIVENIYHSTNKTIIGLTWVSHNINFEYVLKAHDDTFVHIDNAIHFLENINKSFDAYYGNVNVDSLVHRTGAYAVTRREHLLDKYDPYCSGSGFIMTNNSVSEIIPYFDLKRAFKIDDVYIGEIALRAGIPAIHTQGFYMSNIECEYEDDIIASHPVKDFECLKFLTSKSSQINNITKYIIIYIILTFMKNYL